MNGEMTLEAQQSLLDWTGHPFVDVGIATLCCLCQKDNPKNLTLEDLDLAADRMAEYYFSGIMGSYLTCVFMNSAYVQPKMKEVNIRKYEQRVLRAHRFPSEIIDGARCPFSAKEATATIHRSQLPLLTGEDILNFYPDGMGTLPIAGPYLVALQALPLGGRRAEGKLLLVHSDDPFLTLGFARKYLADNQRILNLARTGQLPTVNGPSPLLEREQAAWDKGKKQAKYSDAKAPESLITHDLMEIYNQQDRRFITKAKRDSSITVYWLSNSGQGPSLEIFHLPAQVTGFLRQVESAGHHQAHWRTLVASAWRSPKAERDTQEDNSIDAGSVGEGPYDKEKKGRGSKKREARLVSVPGGPGLSRNDVLADLFTIYESGFLDLAAAKRFLRRHLLLEAPLVRRKEGNFDHRRLQDPERSNWPLTELFLKGVMGMDELRVKVIREFADRLADHISQTNDKALFKHIVYGQKSWEVRNALTKAQRNQAKDRDQLLFGLDEYLKVFEADEAVGLNDWSLIRDLISIRMVEHLYKNGFFHKEENAELLAETDSQTEG